jgi:hypothetical protein
MVAQQVDQPGLAGLGDVRGRAGPGLAAEQVCPQWSVTISALTAFCLDFPDT